VLVNEVMGDPAGFPLIVLHGTPGSSRQLASLDRPARDHKVALIAPDRGSPLQPWPRWPSFSWRVPR
jgi:hypothetical protein